MLEDYSTEKGGGGGSMEFTLTGICKSTWQGVKGLLYREGRGGGGSMEFSLTGICKSTWQGVKGLLYREGRGGGG